MEKLFDFAGLCSGMDVNDFFSPENEERALEVCADCPFRKQCLLDSLKSQDLFGVFGGRTEKQRRRALCLDGYSRATGRKPICPECESKDVIETYKTRMSNDSRCTECGLEWVSTSKMSVRLTSSMG